MKGEKLLKTFEYASSLKGTATLVVTDKRIVDTFENDKTVIKDDIRYDHASSLDASCTKPQPYGKYVFQLIVCLFMLVGSLILTVIANFDFGPSLADIQKAFSSSPYLGYLTIASDVLFLVLVVMNIIRINDLKAIRLSVVVRKNVTTLQEASDASHNRAFGLGHYDCVGMPTVQELKLKVKKEVAHEIMETLGSLILR